MQQSIWDFLTSNQLFVICGPCVIESHEHALMIGGEVANAAQSAGVNAIFKASFDKANRTSLDSYRAPGLEAGLQILADVREKTGLPVLTDIHETGQVEEAAAVCELLQIPAFLSRQTDLLLATGRSGRIVNVKKGQFMAPEDMRHVANKLTSTGNNKIMLTERGSSFGYHDLLVDFRGLVQMKELGYPVVMDVTHSLQQPGSQGTSSGGQPQYIMPLARAAVACGVNGLFVEVHEEPSRAKSDGANALRLEQLTGLLKAVSGIHELVASQQQ